MGAGRTHAPGHMPRPAATTALATPSTCSESSRAFWPAGSSPAASLASVAPTAATRSCFHSPARAARCARPAWRPGWPTQLVARRRLPHRRGRQAPVPPALAAHRPGRREAAIAHRTACASRRGPVRGGVPRRRRPRRGRLPARGQQSPLYTIPLTDDERPYKPRCAFHNGFSLHADLDCHQRDRR